MARIDRKLKRRIFAQVEKNAQADGKGAYFRLHRHRFAALLDALDAPKGADVLEVGVTPGHFTEMMVTAGYKVSGADLNPDNRRALWDRLGVEVRRVNLEREPLPFADASFDRVVFSEVIEHLVYSPLPVIREFYRVLRPGGRVIISTPNELYVKSRMRTLFRILSWQSLATKDEFQHQMTLEGEARYTTHSRTYTMRELCWLMEQAGMRVVGRHYDAAWEKVGVEFSRLWKHPFRVMAKGAFATFTSFIPPTRSMLLVVAERPA